MQIAEAEIQIKTLAPLAKEVEQIKQIESRVIAKEKKIREWQVNYDQWSKLLERLQYSVLPGLKIDNLSQEEKGLSIKGLTVSYSVLARFMTTLEQPGFFNRVELKGISYSNEEKVFSFELLCYWPEGGKKE